MSHGNHRNGNGFPASPFPAGPADAGDSASQSPEVPSFGPGPSQSTAVLPPWPDSIVDPDALSDMQAFNDLKAKRKKQRKRKVIIGVSAAVLVLIALVGAFAWYIADQTAKALESMALQTAPVEQGTFVDSVTASGNLQPISSVSATPEVEGIVGEVFVSEGDRVEAGQTLFTVVNAELDKAVSQAARGIEEARNGVAQAQNSVNEAYRAKSAGQQAAADAQAQAQAQAQAAANSQANAAAGAGSQVPAAAASAGPSFDEGSADAAIRQAELALSSANLALQNAQTVYDEAVARADKRTVASSISGSVVAVNIEPGKALGSSSASNPVSPVQIADLSQMTVSINVNEIDILKISNDQTAKVTFTAAPDLTLPATVVRIATTSAGSGDGSSGAPGGGGAVTYTVKLLIAEPDPRLKPGMTAKATITTTTIENALKVPVSAVQSDGSGGSYLMVVTDPDTQAVESRSVEVIASDGLTSVVKGQVKAGDNVVVSGGFPSGPAGADAAAGDAAMSSGGVSTAVGVG
ncbi:efflux RND transporter periplasmic adaptor subunit [Paraeggerthella hongkongensis]|uniref:RND transporter n=1 Tax=Paraeggerthella hongkongensis TaxID=230658 RepID=A0A3N0B7D3_9ACTN|nr:efflux RND transporter periplasmic adaptor subunit [Paraeggerthella hongkongensis]RNL43110.1 RND transporter [Paraeggerthella hongkongensis]